MLTLGETATFAVVVGGSPPAYQWAFNGISILGATGSSYAVTNVEYANAGTYTVWATNINGSTNAQAVLQVLPPGGPSIRINGQLAVGTVFAIVSAQLTIAGGFTNGFIFYTLDGSVPTTSSPLYAGPVTLTNSTTIRAMSISADFSQSAVSPAVTLQIIPVYSLLTYAVGNGSISASPTSGPYPSNSVVVLTATAAIGCAFDHWAGDLTGSQNPSSLVMDGPRSVQAVFVQTHYPLTATTPGGGSVSVNGEVLSQPTFYPIGSTLTLAATASNGWSFLGWQGAVSGTNNPTDLIMDKTNQVQGIFGTVVATNTTGGGSIILSRTNPIPYGTSLTASAVPDSGNYFVTWSGAVSGTNAPTTISVTSTSAVNALFSALPGGKYSLAVVVMGNGSVAITPQKNYYNPGESVTLSASTTNAGTSFYGWTGDASGTNSSLVVTVSTNKVVQANFVSLPTVNISPQNLVVLAGSNAVLNANAAGLPPLSYQWLKDSVPLEGATNAIYPINNAQPTNAGIYSVIVYNPYGSATSGVATVTVVFPPSIALSPLSQSVAAGTSLTLGVVASGTAPLTYQWFNSLGPIAGATNYGYTLNPVQTNHTDSYAVMVSNPYGVVTSAVATLFVYVPVNITAQPASQAVPARSTVSLSVVAGGYPAPAYQWRFRGTICRGLHRAL